MTNPILTERIYSIMDLRGELALIEAERKLINTIMIVNGVLRMVSNFSWETGHITGYTHSAQDYTKEEAVRVKSLEIFLPSTGLYRSGRFNWLYVEKKPAKHWKKSYSQEGYVVRNLENNAEEDWISILSLVSTKRRDIIITSKDEVFYHDRKIGVCGGGRIICTDGSFHQELKDWVRDEK